MLASKIIGSKSHWFWVGVVVLSPLAYAVAGYLVSRYDPISQTDLTYDRAEVSEVAGKYAKDKGVDVSGWDTLVRTKADNPLRLYYRFKPGVGVDRLKSLAPPVSTTVLFRAPDGNQRIEVRVAPDGRVLGYDRSIDEPSRADDPGEERSLDRARSTLSSWLLPDEQNRLTGPEIKEQRVVDSVTRSYSWKLPVTSHPELDLQYRVSVRGNDILKELVDVQVPERFLHENQILQRFNFRVNNRQVSGLIAISIILYWLVVAIVLILGIYRFIQRARQRELSYKRITILTLIIALLFLMVIILTDLATYDAALVRNTTLLPIYIVGTISYLFMGLFVAIAYGSGEGDLREGYPGKLTSLDALLTGKLFSRNVASAFVLGAAIGGWGMLLFELVPFLWRNIPTAGKQIESLDFLVGRTPWVSPFVILPIDVVLTATIGLLIPLPFIRRRFRKTYLIIGLAVLFAWIASTGSAAYFWPWAGAALLGLIKAGLLLFPFLKFDLLTSLVSLGAPTFITSVAHFIAQPSFSLKRSGYIALGIGLVFLLVEIYFAFKGKLYREEEVGPQYAQHLAERLTMQAEVSAAREAQIRLMPPLAAVTPGLVIAAECLPAQEVGGDYYEVFPLDENRTGIFMAEGGGKGLASALAIAFAKGYILPKVMGSRQLDDSPLEIVRGLQSQFRKSVSDNSDMGVVFAVIDSSEKTMRYARTGSYPRIFVGRRGQEKPLAPDEGETTFATAQGAGRDLFTVTSGWQDLEPDDVVMIFTDGVARAIAHSEEGAAVEFWRELGRQAPDARSEMQSELVTILDKAGKRGAKTGVVADDLTAMIVRLGEVGSA